MAGQRRFASVAPRFTVYQSFSCNVKLKRDGFISMWSLYGNDLLPYLNIQHTKSGYRRIDEVTSHWGEFALQSV